MSALEIINVTYFNPKDSIFKEERSSRECVYYYKCNNHKNCNAYAEGRCLMVNSSLFNSERICPYGKREKEQGFTKAASKCGMLSLKAETDYKDFCYKLKPLDHICVISDYVYIPLTFVHFHKGKDNKHLISKEDFFNINFIINMITDIPTDSYGRPFKSFEEKELPDFLLQLRSYFPELFIELKQKLPKVEEYIRNIKLVGKYAYLYSLLPGDVKIGSRKFKWDGEGLYCKADELILSSKCLFGDEVLKVIPTENTIAEIIDINTCSAKTTFVE